MINTQYDIALQEIHAIREVANELRELNSNIEKILGVLSGQSVSVPFMLPKEALYKTDTVFVDELVYRGEYDAARQTPKFPKRINTDCTWLVITDGYFAQLKQNVMRRGWIYSRITSR